MIIAHFFLRNVRKEPCLFVETTSSQGLEQPAPAAKMLMRVPSVGRRQEWVRKAYYAFVEKFPNLVLVDAMENTLRLESDHPSFDLVFRPKSAADAAGDSAGSGTKGSVPVASVIRNLFSRKQ